MAVLISVSGKIILLNILRLRISRYPPLKLLHLCSRDFVLKLFLQMEALIHSS